MGAFYETISPSVIEWILNQKMFTVATAPLSGQGHVNASPKGGDYFGVLDERTFWYMELSGSGSETVSHLYEAGNGRVTIMFMAFEGAPRILRLYGTGRCLENGTAGFDAFVEKHKVETIPGTRSIILVDVHQVGTSCGFSVPYYDFKAHRTVLNDLFRKRVEKGDSMAEYWAYKNAWSVDGLPSYDVAQKTAKTANVAPIKKFVGAYEKPCYSNQRAAFTTEHLVLVAITSALLTVLTVLYGPSILAILSQAIPPGTRRAVLGPLVSLDES